MGIAQNLAVLALRQVVDGVGHTVGVVAAGQGVHALVATLSRHFSDHSQRLGRALAQANVQAWRALEIALAGDSWWERCQVRLASEEQQAFRKQVQAFLDSTPLAGLPSHGPEFRQECLRQLRLARKSKLFTTGSIDAKDLARRVGDFAQYSDPKAILDAEWQTVELMAQTVRQGGYPGLAQFLALRPDQGPPLIVVAVRYFFRRQVESDPELFQGLAFAQLEKLGQGQEAGFAGLHAALQQHGKRLDELLDDVLTVVTETHADVLDIKAELERQSKQLQELGGAVLQALQAHQADRREVRPGDSLSLRTDGERQLVRQLVARYRNLPEEQRQHLPALLNAVGKLEVMAGDFDSAQRDFQQVARLVQDPVAQAEADHNSYQAALERRQWDEALAALRRAAERAPGRFEPFPLSKYEPQRILGAGGFGVAFLCRHRNTGSSVVVKSLRLDNLDRDAAQVFTEAQALEALEHPAVIRLRDCDFADPKNKARPYLVMEFFDGATLESHVREHGPLTPDEFLPLACQIGEGLEAAHERGILHRDVKPGNLLVRRVEEGPSAPGGWQVKLIDFGLALRQEALRDTVRSAGTSQRTTTGSSIAGTLDYAAPEQMGKLPGVPIGPQADVYGFARTCCFALFQTAQPTFQHWQKVGGPLAELLGECLAEAPGDRPPDFGEVLGRLRGLQMRVVAPRSRSKPVTEEAPPRKSTSGSRAVEEPVARRSSRSDERRRPRRSHDEPAPEPSRRGWGWVWLVCIPLLLVGVVCGSPFYLLYSFLGSPRFPGRPGEPEPVALTADEYPQALADLKSKDPKRARPAALRLAKTDVNPAALKPEGDQPARTAQQLREEAAPLLEALLRSEDNATRTAAAKALGTWGTPEQVPPLIRLVPDNDGNVRAAAMQSLAELKDPRAVNAIAARLGDGWDRDRAAQALKEMGPIAEEAVWPHVLGTDHFTRRKAVQLLATIGTKKSAPVLRTAARCGDSFVEGDARTALAAIGEPLDGPAFAGTSQALDPVEELVRKLSDRNVFAREAAAKALADVNPGSDRWLEGVAMVQAPLAGYPGGMPWLALAVSDPRWPIACPTPRRRKVSEALEPLLRGSFPGEKVAAARALAVWGTAASVPALAALLKDGFAKNAAQEALQNLRAAAVVPVPRGK